MRLKLKFSLAYLLLEVLWVGIFLGAARQAFLIFMTMGAMATVEGDKAKAIQCFLLIMLGMACLGAAIGGIFGSMRRGALFGMGIGHIVLLIPCGLAIVFSHS